MDSQVYALKGPVAKPPSHQFRNLAAIALDALRMWPPFYVRSIFGEPRTWIPPFDRYSEFGMLDLWRPSRTVKYLLSVAVPSLPVTPLPVFPPIVNELFCHPTTILQRPDYYDSYTSYPQEHWFFINGIMTNGDVAHLNAACLTYLFHRPVTLVQNSTDGLALDLLECSLGKEWYLNTESAAKAFPAIYDALKAPEKQKVVVICHSQGTIIMAVVLRGLKALVQRGAAAAGAAVTPEQVQAAQAALLVERPEPSFIYQDDTRLNLDDFGPLSEAELEKLEIYCFANCSTDMRYCRQPEEGRPPIPRIESYANEYDLVARLGMLAPNPVDRQVMIDGPCYVRPGAWGHLLDEHYLLPLAGGQKQGRKRGGSCNALPFRLANPGKYPDAAAPRLVSYINGGSPID